MSLKWHKHDALTMLSIQRYYRPWNTNIMRETMIYLLIGCSSLLIVSYVPHMLLEGMVSKDTESDITLGVTIFWFFVLAGLGWDIVRKRRQQHHD